MSMRLPPRALIALLTVVSIPMICASAPASANQSASAVMAPADGDGYSAEVPIHLPGRREAPAAKDAVLKSLNLLQDASGAITILVESIEESGDTPTADDNDYTRIDNAVQAVEALDDGTIVRLVGTFDWNEENAFASWAADDYGILAPSGVADVTITALALGDAVIIGPGELEDVNIYYEGFLYMWGGLYQGWTVENLDIRGFDWTIGMFYDTGGSTEDFNGVTIRNNRIEMPNDLPGNYSAGVGEVFQNIAFHLGFGENQTIEGNEIFIPGDTNGDDLDPDAVLKASCVALQSNTSGGNAYDGLRIVDNKIHITGAQAAVPEIIYGIWENAAGHTSNIEVSGNSFVNENAGNDPALNFQRAFRVTSHSSATTTVRYADNLVVGANIAIHWIGDNYTSNPPATVYPRGRRGQHPARQRDRGLGPHGRRRC